MSAGSFRQDGLNWRINLIRQRFGEWLEYQVSQFNPDWDVDSEQFKLLWQIIRFALWSIIALLLVWMLWQLWLFLRLYGKRWQRENNSYAPVPPAQMPNLSASDWVERSQSARLEGNYHGAILCLYQAMLKLLDEQDIIPTKLSLTDKEYERSLIKSQISLPPYKLLLSTHQRLCFSNAEADRSLFEECQQAYQQIAS